jgi:divalent metal cation (Fe/Co/Zn/Cd) transporter
LLADAQHSWLDALASVGALALVGAGFRWGDPVAGFAITLFIVHAGVEVTRDLAVRLMDGVDPQDLAAAEHAAQAVPGVRAATVQGRWTGRILRLEIEVDLAADLPLREADTLSRQVEAAISRAVPAARQVHCDTHAAPT